MTPTQPSQAVEAAAKLIYETWKDTPGYRPWPEDGGNSLKQEEARRIARQVAELASQQEVAAPAVLLASVDKVLSEFGTSSDGLQELFQAQKSLASQRVPVALPAEPVAWVVWWGIGQMQKNSVHFERKTAEEVAANIKSATEIRPLYATPAPKQGDAKDARLIELLREARATLEMWKDVAPAVSLCKDIDAAILASKATAAGEGK